MKFLLHCGIDINQQDNFGDTAIHWAVRAGNQVAVRILLEAAADVGIVNNVRIFPQRL